MGVIARNIAPLIRVTINANPYAQMISDNAITVKLAILRDREIKNLTMIMIRKL